MATEAGRSSHPEQNARGLPGWARALRECAAECGAVIPPWEPSSGEDALTWCRRMGIPNEVVCRAAAQALGVPFLESIAGAATVAGFAQHYPIAFARSQGVLAVESPEHGPVLAMGDPASWAQLDVARRLLRTDLTPAFSPLEGVVRAIDAAYQKRSGQAESLISGLDKETVLDELNSTTGREDLLDDAGRAPVIKLVNWMLFDAVKNGASDIHVQPYADRLVVRMRIDGVLFDTFTVPKHLQEEVISRLKVQGKMNIAEKRLPQDGRATVRVGERLIDLRIASLPGSDGERVVVRLLDKSARLYTLSEVGMDRHTLDAYSSLIKLEHGLILVTGPTGSGKSTTLYAALQEINTKDRNVLTLEDPIEYEIDGVSQTQINVKKGLTFATGLRNVLRQDPDIIMVGEVRDRETSVMAIQSALTGHLVFSTLHTNDAASAVTRMLDLGTEPYLLSSSLLAVLAQRLVRKVCPDCARPRTLSESEMTSLELPRAQFSDREVLEGQGCDACRGTGYRGRDGLFELLVVDEPTRDAIQCRANASEIRDAAVNSGMRLLRQDGLEKVLAGKTTIEEVERVTVRESR